MNKPVLSTFSGDYSLLDIKKGMEKFISILLETERSLQGKKVGILVPQIPNYLELFLAVNQLGGIVIPFSYQLRKDDLKALLDLLDPHIVFTVKEFNGYNFGDAITQWGKASQKETIIYLSDNGKNWTERKVIEGKQRPLETEKVDIIGYSSGSTGIPKGMMFDTEFIICHAQSIISTLELNSMDRVYHNVSPCLPYGLFWFFAGLKSRIQTITSETFDVPKIVQLIKDKKPTKISSSPSLFRAIYTFAKEMRALDCFENVELCSIGGEMIQNDLIDLISETLHCKLISTYGLSELGFLMYTPIDLRQGIEWKVIEGVDYRIVNDELLFKVPKIFLGYYKRPDLTKKVLDEQSWYYTGDIADINSNNRIVLKGRKKDLIKKGGQSIIPGEIEYVISQHPYIKQCVVVGIPHPILGEKVVAFIVSEGDLSAQQLKTFCSNKIATYKVPDQFKFINEIPMNNGKIDRLSLKKMIGVYKERNPI